MTISTERKIDHKMSNHHFTISELLSGFTFMRQITTTVYNKHAINIGIMTYKEYGLIVVLNAAKVSEEGNKLISISGITPIDTNIQQQKHKIISFLIWVFIKFT